MTISRRLSVAIPMFNEEQVLPELLGRLRRVLDDIPGGPHEIVFVDDGSADRTFEMLAEEAARDPRVVAIALSRNFGHQLAMTSAATSMSTATTLWALNPGVSWILFARGVRFDSKFPEHALPEAMANNLRVYGRRPLGFCQPPAGRETE